ncbi:oxygenase MpaB family protein [Rathayibacter soli]|uniref:oxygenase MpaB family protein n=1 Tax=Rathayibacter soli TaxID=3144168 RepID=UPI0027E569B7|nr:oxygenase MpaB family protein [Glaciibacter superstes]
MARGAAVHGIRDLADEGVLIAGGGRAILLQIAYPGVGRGVAEHSDFASRPLDRLHATLTYAYAVVYGTDAEIAAVRRRVNRAHASVNGPADADGPAYDAYDPSLQLWVAATLYDTAIGLYERIFGALDDETAERVYREYGALGTVLQVPPGAWPVDRAAFRAYWDATLPTLHATDATRLVAQDLLHPRVGPLWLKAVMPLARLMTVGLLPAALRDEFHLSWGPRHERRFQCWLRVTAVVFPRLPARLRHAPRRRELAALRRELAAGSRYGR